MYGCTVRSSQEESYAWMNERKAVQICDKPSDKGIHISMVP